jgi:transposase-like protein
VKICRLEIFQGGVAMTLEEFQVESKKRKVGRGRKPQPYSEEQKSFAKAFAKKAISEGVPRSVVIRRLGISATALKKWLSPEQNDAGGGFRRIKISTAVEESNRPVLVTPSGHRVEGISIENLVYLLRLL